MDPPAYTPAPNHSDKTWDLRMKIIVGLDYGTTNSGKNFEAFRGMAIEQYRYKLCDI
jgi:hypothetical protein